jgi:choline dehydrogenase
MYQVTQRGGMRASAAVAYLHPAMERENLTVMPYMQVQRVLFEGTRAVGVQASQLGEAQELRAEREVILCGGAYNSPQLLMLSGVGPAEHLTMREVEVLLDQPVGRREPVRPRRHQLVWTTPEERRACCCARAGGAGSSTKPRRPGRSPPTFAEAGGFARVGAGAPAPDIQFHVVPCSIVDEGMSDPRGPRRVGVAVPADAAQQRQRCASPPTIRAPSRSCTTPSTRRATTCSG